MTKKDAANRLYGLSILIRREMGGDEDADIWVAILESIAHDLDPKNLRYIESALRETGVSKKVKLRRLIDHPETPESERRAALAALGRMRSE